MSISAGAAGAFGILLSAQPEVVDLHREFKEYMDEYMLECDYDELDQAPRVAEFRKRFIAAFKNSGIIVPHEAQIYWTDSEDVRPAECFTPSDEFVLGFGLFTLPWNYPAMDKSFKRVAAWHACMGWLIQPIFTKGGRMSTKAIAFPAASVSRPSGVLHLYSTSCATGHHQECAGAAKLPGMTIECTCVCHDGKPATNRAIEFEYEAA